MDKFINKILFYIIIFFISFISVLFIGFKSFSLDSYALADPILDSSSLEVLQGGNNSAFNSMNYYGFNNDFGSLFFVDSASRIYDDINNKLFDKYGADLESAYWEWDENQNPNTIVQKLMKTSTKGAAEAIQNGFKVLSTSALTGYLAGKVYITGKVNDITNKVTDVYNNAYVYITDSFTNKASEVKTELEQSGDILNFTLDNVFYKDNVSFGSSFDFNVRQFKLDRPFVFYNSGNVGSGNTYIGIMYPASYTLSQHFVSGMGVGLSGTTYQFTSISYIPNSYQGYTTINNIQYVYSYIQLGYSGGTTMVLANDPPNFSFQQAKDFIAAFDPYNTGLAYSYNSSNSQNIKDLLDLLKNKWVTTDELRQINEKLDSLQLGNIDLNGNTSNVIDTSSDKLNELSNLINQIINNNADINNNDVLPDPEPAPEPEPEPDIVLPGDLWPEFFPDLLTDDMFSMFKPVFDIVGANYSMHDLWVMIPSIMIFILVLYLIVSIF